MDPAGALSFNSYGVVVTPRYGAIALIKTGSATGFSNSGYHVGFVTKVNSDGTVSILGGNQSDSVKISNFKAENVVRYCWPSEADTTQEELEEKVRHTGSNTD